MDTDADVQIDPATTPEGRELTQTLDDLEAENYPMAGDAEREG